MSNVIVDIYRGTLVESSHRAIILVKDSFNNCLISTNNESSLIYPRSAIKIFQALPFIISKAHELYNLNEKNIAISCSSHIGEPMHLKVLLSWIEKINIAEQQLKCGIHNPIDQQSSNNLFLSGKKPNQLHNNCSGKHLAMISGCLSKKMEINNYINFNHPYQKLIRDSLETFMETKIKKNCIGIDGCNVPQYAFPLENIVKSMVNLSKIYELSNEYSEAVKIIIKSINAHPLLIGGTKRFDSTVIKSTKGKIFCKGGAEGVLLFSDFSKKIGGVIKIIDGNYRAVAPIALQVFLKLNLLNENEKKNIKFCINNKIYNHAKKEVGKIFAKL